MAGMAPRWWNEQWPLGVLLGTFTGKAYYRGSIERAKDPAGYWMLVTTEYMVAAFLIWYYYYALAP
jgi:hypothetical protein